MPFYPQEGKHEPKKNIRDSSLRTMIRENGQLVTNEPVEVENCRKITDRFRIIYRIYPNLIKENRRMSTCNRLDLQTLGSQPIMPKNLPDHCLRMPEGHHLHSISRIVIDVLLRTVLPSTYIADNGREWGPSGPLCQLTYCKDPAWSADPWNHASSHSL